MPRLRLEERDDRFVLEERLRERERFLARLRRAAHGEPGPGRQRDLRSVRPGRDLCQTPPQGLVVRTSLDQRRKRPQRRLVVTHREIEIELPRQHPIFAGRERDETHPEALGAAGVVLGQGQVDSAREQAPIGGPAPDRLFDHLQGARAVVGRPQNVDRREQVGRAVVARSGGGAGGQVRHRALRKVTRRAVPPSGEQRPLAPARGFLARQAFVDRRGVPR